MQNRERWATRIGLVLAMAGNAVGLGNFLRFPVQAAENGGGAFMIPYLISFLLMGIPLMWIEWALGRYGGVRGHGTTPAIFEYITRRRLFGILGVLGVTMPFMVAIYYTYIESWTLGYSISALMGMFPSVREALSGTSVLEPFNQFFQNYTGMGGSEAFVRPSTMAYVFFLLTFFINVFFVYRGIAKGIEILAKVAMPILLALAVVLAVRVATLEPISGHSPLDGFGFLWNPDFSKVFDAQTWLAAAGQIFFTLSIGFGTLITYASYLSEKDDIALGGLSAATTNEFVEVVLGASIAIPAAVVFFGIENTVEIAKAGSFSLGFITMPAIFSYIPLGNLFGFMWFFLLFLAGITSSVALIQPMVAFLEDEYGIKRQKAVILVAAIMFVLMHIPVLMNGALDEMDYWAGTVGLVALAFLELFVFVWMFGVDNAWREINRSAQIRIPIIYKYIMAYITPLFIIVIMVSFAKDLFIKAITFDNPGELAARLLMIGVFIVLAVLYAISRSRKR